MALTTVPASLSATALTLTTAAQPNITSVGTLTGLTVSGDLTIDTSTLVVDATNNRVGIGTSSPTYKLNVLASSGSQNIFQAGQSGISNGLSITSNGSALTYSFLTGNVGIGTSSPNNTLSILGSVNQLDIETTTTGVTVESIDRSDLSAQSDLSFYARNGAHKFFGASYTQHMTIDSSGNVGIGESNPARRLSVRRDTGITTGFNDISQFLDTTLGVGGSVSLNLGRANSTKNLGKMAFKYAGSGSNSNALNFGFYDADNLMTLLAGGNVGIGTTSPSTKLHIGGTAPGDSIIRQDSTVSGTNWEIGERAAGKWQIFEDDGDSIVATFMSTGNVGIGTQLPQAAKFSGSAVGILELAGTKPVINIHETDVTDAEFFMGMSGGTAFLGTTGDGILAFSTGTSSASEAMRIDSNGGIILSNHYWVNNDVFKVYNITGPSTSSFTRTIDVNSFWGYAAQGGFFMYAIHGWQGDEAAGLIAWSNAGNSSQVIVNVFHREFFTPTFTSVTATKGSGDREIDITINGAHTNTHGWRWVVWA